MSAYYNITYDYDFIGIEIIKLSHDQIFKPLL